MKEKSIWVFNGNTNHFPSAIFTNKDLAENWIKTNNLQGTLTEYPVDISVYDWAIINNYFKPKNDKQKSPSFIGNFSSASQEHYHYE